MSLSQSVGGIACRVLHDGSGSEDFGSYGANSSGVMIYACAWADRLTLRQKIVGDLYNDPSGNIIVVPALAHPNYPFLYGNEVKIDALGQPTGTYSWQYAKLTATFKPRASNSNNPSDLKEESYELSGDVQVTDADGWVVDTGEPDAGKAVKSTHQISKPIPHKNLRIVLFAAAALPTTAVDALYGKLNNATTIISGRSYPAFTVLYGGWQASRKTTSAGNTNYQITHHFLISPIDQRKEFVFGKLQLIKSAGGDYKFESGDFAAIFGASGITLGTP